MRALFALLLLASIALLPATGGAQAPNRAEVRTLLSGFESSASASEWAAMGPSTVPVLVSLFDDTSELQPVRLRAVWAARFFATDASRAFLGRVMANRAESGIVIRMAVESMASAFGESAVSEIAPFLAHADVAVREGAILALGRVGGGAARAALEARRGRERDEALAPLLTETLRLFAARGVLH